jgi:beta-galactosidase/beta-glucuronidase
MILARFVVSVLLCSATALGATQVNFDPDWRFHLDTDKSGEAKSWMQRLPADAELVSLPHTWNVGKYSTYQGTAWYFKTFPRSASWEKQHVEIHFGATFYKSRVWLNGALLGEHEGGYSEYHFDMTNHLQDMNLLVVQINNEPKGDTIPGADLKAAPDGAIYDWWPYGGITRDVWLTVTEGVVVRWQHINAKPSGTSAEVADHIRIDNATGRSQTIKLRVQIFSSDHAAPITSHEQEVKLGSNSTFVDNALTLPDVRRWSIDDSFLYRSEVTLLTSSGHVLDVLTDSFGVRTIEIRDRHLYLNGNPVRLTGVTRHEDSPWEGSGETRGTMLHDLMDLKDLHTTLTRPVHYQQNPYIYDFADRNGILMIPEIPMWQFNESQMQNPKVIALAKQELRELIEQNYNHPSIFAWSMENESATNTPGGIAYFQEMYAESKRLDPNRYVSYADDMIAFVEPSANAARFADFIMWNEYFGSWDGPETMLPAAFEKIGKGYPDKMVFVTEFGYPGVFASDSEVADRERQRIIRRQLSEFGKHDWIAGAIFWCYQDYQSTHNLRSSQADHYVDHGVVDKNRQRRPSYYVWRDATTPAHIDLDWDVDAKGVPLGFQATIERRSQQEIPSYPLFLYRAEWRLIDSKGKQVADAAQILPDIGPPQRLAGTWTKPESDSLRLLFTLYDPNGMSVMQKILTWRNPQTGTLVEQDFNTGNSVNP